MKFSFKNYNFEVKKMTEGFFSCTLCNRKKLLCGINSTDIQDIKEFINRKYKAILTR